MKAEYKYLRPKKAESLKAWLGNGFYIKDELKAHRFSGATILPLKKFENDPLQFGRGGVTDSQGNYQEVSGIDGRVGGFYETEQSEQRDERVVYCGYLVKHWGHFLVEGAARLWYCFEKDRTVDKYVFITEENGSCEAKGNYGEFLQLLGIADKIEIINRPVKYREVIVPELGYKRKVYYSEKYKHIFDAIAANALKEYTDKNTAADKIYLSRGQFGKALEAEAGLDMLDNYFDRNGFAVLYPEKLSLGEMIFYIRNAKVCAAESGTVPHNMRFAADEQKLVIIERQSIITEIQADVDRIKNLDVTYIDAHYTIYPVSAGFGPYILAYNQWLELYSTDYGFLPPDKEYLTPRYLKACFSQYMRVYRRTYGYGWQMDAWLLQYAEAILEAYEESARVFRDYLERREPFTWKQCFMWHYVKQKLHQLKLRITR